MLPETIPACSNCGGTRFHFCQYEIYIYDFGQVSDAEESGLDVESGAICRGCGAAHDSQTEVWKAICGAWEKKWR